MVNTTYYNQRYRRRGAIAPLVAITSVLMLGFAALSVDVGHLYDVRAEAQQTADAAALAAASRLGLGTVNEACALARAEAATYASLNRVAGRPAQLDMERDVEFGMAECDPATGKYGFGPAVGRPTAVRVTVRKTADSPNGPVDLFFARVLGRHYADVSASATAMIIPRDVALVIDLTGSMNDDSELQHLRDTVINNYDVWANLPPNGGVAWPNPLVSAADVGTLAGPAWGFMPNLGWGTQHMDPARYTPLDDPGLAYLPPQQDWNVDTLAQAMLASGYSAQEVDQFTRNNYHDWASRVAVGLGLAVWRSGISGGLWQSAGLPRGDGDTRIESNELTWVEPYPYPRGSWSDYFNYVGSSRSTMLQGDANFRYRFGLKTFVDYLLVNQNTYDATPALAGTPAQPMEAVKAAVRHMVDVISSLDSDDRVSLEVYAQYGYHEVDLGEDYEAIRDRLDQMQAGHYTQVTNIAAGIEAGIAELTGQRARPEAIKMMVLLTDGIANVDEFGRYSADGTAGGEYAVERAEAAAALGIRVYTVSVGSAADRDLMRKIAQVGSGQEFFAGGPVETYTAELQSIFATLGGKTLTRLIQ